MKLFTYLLLITAAASMLFVSCAQETDQSGNSNVSSTTVASSVFAYPPSPERYISDLQSKKL